MNTAHKRQAPWTLCTAPMMDWTDKHCRYFHRILSPNARLFTEMVTAPAILHGDKQRLLGFNGTEHPVALQLGGSDPAQLAESARIGAAFGYDEINLNCGCPSDRVQQGMFGACLMAQPDLVARCVDAMRRAVPDHVPVTVKCRIAIDDYDPAPFLTCFLETVSAAGCDVFTIHARKAWLKGLSPKENRDIPPLDYDLAAAMKARYPHLTIILNGGLTTSEQVARELPRFDGVMIGRAAYQSPDILRTLEHDLFGTPPATDESIIAAMADYIDMVDVTRPVIRHMVGLFGGRTGARKWRQGLSALPEGAGGKGLTDVFTASGLK